MHILFSTHTEMDANGGDTIHVSELARELARAGNRVTLLASGKPKFPVDGVDAIDVGRIRWSGVLSKFLTFPPVLFRSLRHVFRLRKQVDVLYTRSSLLGFFYILLRPLFGLPVIFEVNGLKVDETNILSRSFGARFQSAIFSLTEKRTAREAEAVVCVTEGIRDVLAEEYGVSRDRLKVVHNGVNLDLYSPDRDRKKQEALKIQLGLGEKDAVVVFLGTLKPWQDVSTLLDAVGLLDLKDRNPVLLVLGGGEQREELERRARSLPPTVRVVFTGEIPYEEAGAYVCLAHVCAMPFTRERNERIGLSPLKLYTYLACGKPIVATRLRGFGFLEREGLGSLVPLEDPDAFAAGLKEWLEKTEREDAISRRARRYAEDHCGWEQVARSVSETCRNVLEKQTAPTEKREPS